MNKVEILLTGDKAIMIEFYTIGKNRIVYKAENFEKGKEITAFFWNPSLVKSEKTFIELEDIETEEKYGLYYLDYDFDMEGVYIGLFFENGVKKAFSTFRIMEHGVGSWEKESSTKIDNELSKRHGDGKWDKKG